MISYLYHALTISDTDTREAKWTYRRCFPSPMTDVTLHRMPSPSVFFCLLR